MTTCAGDMCATTSISQPSGCDRLISSEPKVPFFRENAHFLPFWLVLISLLPASFQSAQMRTCAGDMCATTSISQPSGCDRPISSEPKVPFFRENAHFLPFWLVLISLLPASFQSAQMRTCAGDMCATTSISQPSGCDGLISSKHNKQIDTSM